MRHYQRRTQWQHCGGCCWLVFGAKGAEVKQRVWGSCSQFGWLCFLLRGLACLPWSSSLTPKWGHLVTDFLMRGMWTQQMVLPRENTHYHRYKCTKSSFSRIIWAKPSFASSETERRMWNHHISSLPERLSTCSTHRCLTPAERDQWKEATTVCEVCWKPLLHKGRHVAASANLNQDQRSDQVDRNDDLTPADEINMLL